MINGIETSRKARVKTLSDGLKARSEATDVERGGQGLNMKNVGKITGCVYTGAIVPVTGRSDDWSQKRGSWRGRSSETRLRCEGKSMTGMLRKTGERIVRESS
jgi:hypothetical protein